MTFISNERIYFAVYCLAIWIITETYSIRFHRVLLFREPKVWSGTELSHHAVEINVDMQRTSDNTVS